jgi:hypothetical protein
VTQRGSGPRTLSIFDESSLRIGGELDWIPVRRRLDIGAFGINAYRAADQGDPVIEEHVESPGQEELYLVLRGRARIVVGDESFDAGPGVAVFAPDPDVRRSGTALADETVVIAIGGWRERPYRPLPWEVIYLSHEALEDGDWAAAAETLERESGEHRGNAFVRYRLACCYAELGDEPLALDELRAAIDQRPEMRERAAGDEHFASLRETDEWRALVTGPRR